MNRNLPRVIPEIEEDTTQRVVNTQQRLTTQIQVPEYGNFHEIQFEMLKWIRLSIALLLGGIFLFFSFQFEASYYLPLLPMIILDLEIIFHNTYLIIKRSMYFIFSPSSIKNQISDSIEATGTLLFKLLLLLYKNSQDFKFSYTIVPMALVMVVRIFLRTRITHQCQSFSNMFWFLGRWIRLTCFFCIGLKLDGVVDWSWTGALWPLWVGVCFLALISIGILLLTLGSLFSYFAHQSSISEVISSLWLLYATSGASFSFGLFFFTLTQIETGLSPAQATIFPILYLLLFLFFTLGIYKILLQWWNVFLINNQDLIENEEPNEAPPSLPTQIVSALKKPPKALIRLSSTYFQPADQVQILPNIPNERRANSQLVQELQIPTHQRFFSHQLDQRQMHLQRRPSNYILNNSTDISVLEKVCAMCCQNNCNAVIMECGHGGVCYDCALNIWKANGLCHMCRTPMAQVLQIKLEPSKVLKVLSTTRAVYHK